MRDKIKLVSTAGTGYYYHYQKQALLYWQNGNQKV